MWWSAARCLRDSSQCRAVAGCIAGALEEQEYLDKLAAAGFEEATIEPTRIYKMEDAREFLACSGIDVDAIAAEVEGKFMSAFVRARRPS